MMDINEIKKYINGKMAILQDDFNKLDAESFYDSGLEDGVPMGQDTGEIYDNGFDCGVLHGEYNTLAMIKILLDAK